MSIRPQVNCVQRECGRAAQRETSIVATWYERRLNANHGFAAKCGKAFKGYLPVGGGTCAGLAGLAGPGAITGWMMWLH